MRQVIADVVDGDMRVEDATFRTYRCPSSAASQRSGSTMAGTGARALTGSRRLCEGNLGCHIATGQPLMGPFHIVVHLVACRDLAHGGHIRRAEDVQTFLVIGAVVALNKTIEAPRRRGGNTVTWTPKHSQNRTNGDGKSRRPVRPTKRLSRSNITTSGSPCSWSVSATASSVVAAVKSARTWAPSNSDDPASTVLSTSTTCYCLPSSSAVTEEASLKSSCHTVSGAGRGMVSCRRGRGCAMRPCWCRMRQIVRVERGS